MKKNAATWEHKKRDRSTTSSASQKPKPVHTKKENKSTVRFRAQTRSATIFCDRSLGRVLQPLEQYHPPPAAPALPPPLPQPRNCSQCNSRNTRKKKLRNKIYTSKTALDPFKAYRKKQIRSTQRSLPRIASKNAFHPLDPERRFASCAGRGITRSGSGTQERRRQ